MLQSTVAIEIAGDRERPSSFPLRDRGGGSGAGESQGPGSRRWPEDRDVGRAVPVVVSRHRNVGAVTPRGGAVRPVRRKCQVPSPRSMAWTLRRRRFHRHRAVGGHGKVANGAPPDNGPMRVIPPLMFPPKPTPRTTVDTRRCPPCDRRHCSPLEPGRQTHRPTAGPWALPFSQTGVYPDAAAWPEHRGIAAAVSIEVIREL